MRYYPRTSFAHTNAMPPLMEQPPLPTEVILSHPRQTVARLTLDWQPQPGALLEVDGATYKVLERRHRYHLQAGRYRLHKISLYVQAAQPPAESSLIDGCWVIGDATCRFNARSELLRCAVNPAGPCAGCRDYEPGGRSPDTPSPP